MKDIFRTTDKIYDRVFKIPIVLVFALYLVLNIWMVLSQFFRGYYKTILLSFAAISAYMVAMFIISKLLRDDKTAVPALLIVSVAVLVGWRSVYAPQPAIDQAVLWQGAHDILDGTFSARAADKSDYFCFFNFQIGYAWYISLFLRIYDSLLTMQIVEFAVMTATNFVLYKTVRLFYSVGTAFLSASLFASFSYIFVCSGVITNQHEGMLFCAVALYLILRYKGYWKYAVSAVLLAVGNTLRPTVVMIFVSIAFVIFINCFFDKKNLIVLVLFVAVYLVCGELINYMFMISSLAPYGIKSSNLYFKIILGLTNGGISGQRTTGPEKTFLYYDLKYYNFDYEKYKEASRKFLYDLILNGKIDGNSLVNKVIYFINGTDEQYVFGDVEFNRSHALLIECINFTGTFLYLVAIAGTFVNALHQKSILKNIRFFLPAAAFCAYLCIYIVFESAPRYRYEQYYILFFLSAPALYSGLDLFGRKLPFLKRFEK